MRNVLSIQDPGSLRRAVNGGSTDWIRTLRSATVTGTFAAGTTAASLTNSGAHDAGSAVAPINATSHIAWGERSGHVERVDAKHTLLGGAIHLGACIFWAAV